MIEIARQVHDISGTKEYELNSKMLAIDSFRQHHAWVLLGEPGAGKTTALRKEALAVGGEYISIAAFITADIDQWRDKTLFLDGLDEIQIDIFLIEKIKAQLMRLASPPFRLACRAANWYGGIKESLTELCPDNHLTLLELVSLSENEVLQLLEEELDLDPEDFMQKAKNFGVDDLLKNPEMLNLMVKAIQSKKWPKNREEVYQLACEQLAYENNPLHRQRHREDPIKPRDIILAAGYLCSILLLTDNPGVALDESSSDHQFITIDDCDPENRTATALAVQKKLFTPCGKEHVVPAHRSVAEYLASRWICEKITHKGLSIKRLKQVLLDADEYIKTSLWGLCGWLAQHHLAMRRWIVAASPLAALYYGDVQYWSIEDRTAVFEALIKTPLSFIPPTLMYTFSALALLELSDQFKSILSDYQQFTSTQRQYVLMILNSPDTVMPGFDIEVEKLLIEQINSLVENNIIDEALAYLYPQYLTIDELFKYLNTIYMNDESFFRNYYHPFLNEAIVHKTLESELPLLAEKLFYFLAEHKDLGIYFQPLLSLLLLEIIHTCGLNMPVEQLFNALKLGGFLDNFGKQDRAEQEIDRWFAQHPQRYQDVMDFLLDRAQQATDNWFKDIHYLTYITPPPSMNIWYFEKAATLDNAQLNEYCLKQAINLLCKAYPNDFIFIRQKLDEWVLSYLDKKDWLQSQWEDVLEQHQNPDDSALRVPNDIQIKLMKKLSVIQNGSAAPGILGYLADIWRGVPDNPKIDRENNFKKHFGVDGVALYQAAKEGFKRCLERKDLLTALEIIKLYNRGKIYRLNFPCLIGVDLIWQDTPTEITNICEGTVASIIAFYLCGYDSVPDWLNALSLSHLDVLVEVMISFAEQTKKLGTPEFPINAGFYQLLSNTHIVQRTVLELLRVFPLRANITQLGYLDRLLESAFKQRLPGLNAVIQHKISLESIDDAQKVYWYAAAALLSPSDYAQTLLKYLGNSSARILSLARFIETNFNSILILYPLPPHVIADFIALFTPYLEVFLSAAPNNLLLQRLIEVLKRDSTEEAGSALLRLCDAEATEKIHPFLKQAQQIQKRHRENVPLTAPAVAKVLRQSLPINEQDLWAITLDKLDDIINNIEKSNANKHEIYWENRDTKERIPEDEDFCRNRLLDHLREALPMAISCESEVDHRLHKRADITVVYQQYKIPIEIKCDFSEKLSVKLREQLINQYTTSTGANGHGIYVIFWFKAQTKQRSKQPRAPGDGGRKAKTPQDLQKRLLQQLTPEEQERIAIKVIDVSWPV